MGLEMVVSEGIKVGAGRSRSERLGISSLGLSDLCAPLKDVSRSPLCAQSDSSIDPDTQ